MRTLSLLITLLLTTLSLAARKPSNAILLSSVKTLTLYANKPTTSRRLSPIPQLTCVGGSGCAHYQIDTLRCQNSGSGYDPEDIEWTCQAELPPEFKLGSTQVVCEGYEGPEDSYVLKGSCGVEYRLLLTDLGEEKFGGGFFGGSRGGAVGKGLGARLFEVVFWGLFLGIIGLIIYSVYTNNGAGGGNAGRRRPGNFGGFGGGGWGGGDDNNDPPPPYTPHSQPRKSNSSSRSSSSSAQGWRPGFWSGAAAGVAGASLLNRNRGGGYAQAGPSNWFGNGGGRAAGPQRGVPSWGGGGGSSSSAPSTSRYESTGFGGTSRR